MRKAIIFDIDGTVANCEHRQHLAAVNFTAFEDGCVDDTPYENVIEIIRRIDRANIGLHPQDRITIFACSGRQDKYRKITEDHLLAWDCPYEELLMRPTGDCRKDSIVKAQFLDYIQQTHEVIMAFDDRQQVVDMWRERGITCAQVREWNENKSKYPLGRLTLMVGPSGAGKSQWTYNIDHGCPTPHGQRHRDVISSDEIRQQLCGDKADQSKNEQVFAYMHAFTKVRIQHGFDVVVDATNIRNKDRLAFVDLVPGVEIDYIIIDRPLEQKLKDRGWRSEELIRRHHTTMQNNLKDILKGDNRPNVTVHDKRQ